MFATGFWVSARKPGLEDEWAEFRSLAEALAWRADKEAAGWVCGDPVAVDVHELIQGGGAA